MDVTSSTATTGTQQNTAAQSTGASTLGYDAFLKLLVAQMQNQDPTKPMDSTEFVAQLASFSGVEQSVKINSKLDALITSIGLNQADALIGKYVSNFDGSIAGKVVAVQAFSDGTVAELEDGRHIMLESGIKISDTPPKEEAAA
ncbi:flagellar basal body rod modification protein FlgD [Hyphomicrobium nitrativorans NL23]|uniref:Basal-body rod modification protein FlgD n=1 Tax=Hyphomicrobium nitrativorans NL23 TaxID=1029756 RepID=V5SCP7_9HYPH|nr:flagellar hook assembly protein FlgD [Hyphomicrobium nitrativorans]AHB47749.1 flagellar basal body rod modification protein FlgD [Hyphomicrobium nitrativorans NL23]